MKLHEYYYLCCILFTSDVCNSSTTDEARDTFVQLPRFWTNVGFSPAAPLPLDSSQVADVLLSDDVQHNLEIIATLPNKAIATMRIHWLLSLVRMQCNVFHTETFYTNFSMLRRCQRNARVDYDFSMLDRFLDFLAENRLAPVIEMMGNLISGDLKDRWTDLTINILVRYAARYQPAYMSKWRFETWNEPDLRAYNILNMTSADYFDYIAGINRGLRQFSQLNNSTKHLLRGPAGLFKSAEKHQLCWGILDNCNSNMDSCPLDILTFHRKGQSSIDDILNETIALLQSIHSKYPNLRQLPYENSEADPTSGWAKQHSPYADVRYANMLIRTVFQHWDATYTQQLPSLESISHDNAFLSYHPFEFEQRTLLAKFSMNNTAPPHVQFLRKPVHSALGMLGSLGNYASSTKNTDGNMVCLTTISINYGAVICTSSDDKIERNIVGVNVMVNASELLDREAYSANRDAAYFVEYLSNELTDPYFIWNQWKKPPYPNVTVFTDMRRAEGPHALGSPVQVPADGIVSVALELNAPWVMLLRICAQAVECPHRVTNLRIRRINDKLLLLLWSERAYRMNTRCVRSYEIFYSKMDSSLQGSYVIQRHHREWTNIAIGHHIPFLSYHYNCESPHCDGLYKVRAIDIFNRTSQFSRPQFYSNN